MRNNTRKEIKIGILLFAIFNVVRFVTNEIGSELLVLHFLLGGIAGLAFAEIVVGLLPDPIYIKLKCYKKRLVHFKNRCVE